MSAKIVEFESKLDTSRIEIVTLEASLSDLGEEKRGDEETNEVEKKKIEKAKKAKLKKANTTLESEIESLNKEKSFIINQNEHQHKIVLGDYLSQQEKLTDLSYQINKLTSENDELKKTASEGRKHLKKSETELGEINLKLILEINEKNDALEKIRTFESQIEKVLDF